MVDAHSHLVVLQENRFVMNRFVMNMSTFYSRWFYHKCTKLHKVEFATTILVNESKEGLEVGGVKSRAYPPVL
jgi:hypothetical protein